jgi:hypothetical protein
VEGHHGEDRDAPEGLDRFEFLHQLSLRRSGRSSLPAPIADRPGLTDRRISVAAGWLSDVFL